MQNNVVTMSSQNDGTACRRHAMLARSYTGTCTRMGLRVPSCSLRLNEQRAYMLQVDAYSTKSGVSSRPVDSRRRKTCKIEGARSQRWRFRLVPYSAIM